MPPRLAALTKNPKAEWNKPAITQVRRINGAQTVMGYSLRTERHRYTSWLDGATGEELYDYGKDPRELKNLAAHGGSQAKKRELQTLLTDTLRARGKAVAGG